MPQTTNINKIKNDYILKSLFSYISYQKILKLIKINKNLHSRLGIKLKNYACEIDFPEYEYIKEKKLYKSMCDCSVVIPILLQIIMTILCFPYYFIYSLLLICIKTFNDNNLKEDYNKSELKTIKALNIYIFISNFSIIGFLFLFYFDFISFFITHGIKK